MPKTCTGHIGNKINQVRSKIELHEMVSAVASETLCSREQSALRSRLCRRERGNRVI